MKKQEKSITLPAREGYFGPELRWEGKKPLRSVRICPAKLKEVYGQAKDGWYDRLYRGDNLLVMGHLLSEFRGGIDLCYIDPPFDSRSEYQKKVEVRGGGETFQDKQYSDIWVNDGYLRFMYERLILIRELLSEKGVLYLHCDYRKMAHLRLLCDEIFGPENFLNLITWRRQIVRGMKGYARYYPFSADYILIYGRNGKKATWNRQTRTNYISLEEAQKKYQKDERGFFRTSDPGTYSFESLCRLYEEGRLYAPNKGEVLIDRDKEEIRTSKGGKLAVKYYREQVGNRVAEEVVVDNIWDDIPGMGIVSSEYLGYPTQKPEKLLERVLLASTEPGDLVFDCFMGSGTTQVVAAKMGRRFIGADINLGAVRTTVRRLLSRKEEEAPGFTVWQVGDHDLFRNEQEAKELMIRELGICPLPQADIWDGEMEGRKVKFLPFDRVAGEEDLAELKSILPLKQYREQVKNAPDQPAEKITLISMGTEPGLDRKLDRYAARHGLDIRVLDLFRDRPELRFKQESEAKLRIEDGVLSISSFTPRNLLEKLSREKKDSPEEKKDWRELVDYLLIDWNYDGEVFRPETADIPGKKEMVRGSYAVPESAGRTMVRIVDLLAEALDVEPE